MVQGIFGGGTSYEGQSISDIQQDVKCWKRYTENIASQINEEKEALVKSGFWNKIPWNFNKLLMNQSFVLKHFSVIFR